MDLLIYLLIAAGLAVAGYTGFKYLNRSRNTNVSARNNSIAAGRDVDVNSRHGPKDK
jgi:hypothetical protein